MLPLLDKKSGPRILVVDDDPNEMRSLVIGLRLEGFEAVGVPSGLLALQTLAAEPYSAVIIDLMMPQMNGLQLARAIRSSHPEAMTMLMSAYHLSPLQLARADAGVTGFVPKPFCFDELVRFLWTKLTPQLHDDGRFEARLDSGLSAPIDMSAVVDDQMPRPAISEFPLPK